MNTSFNSLEILPTSLSHQNRFPATAESRPMPRTAAPFNAGRGLKRILLADDDPGIRLMLGRVLESENYEVLFARDGREAAAKFVKDPPDLVLLDLNMPGRDGWAAFRLMNVAHPMLPIIVITARPNQREKAVELGVDALMEKPLDLPILLKAISDLVNEDENERTQRVIDPNFTTALLEQRKNSSGTEL